MLKVSRIYLVALVSLAALAVTGPALAAHNGNNKAELNSTTSDATGVAVVNYSEGQGTFNGTITVRGLAANTAYSFTVAGTMGTRTICSGISNSSGTFTCSEQKLTLPGFVTAQVVRTSDGMIVASGTFERRGNCRDPEQAGSQCKAQRP